MGKKNKKSKEAESCRGEERTEESYEDYVLITITKSRYSFGAYDDISYIVCDNQGHFIDAFLRRSTAIDAIAKLLADRVAELKK